jgi:hypothetical protein
MKHLVLILSTLALSLASWSGARASDDAEHTEQPAIVTNMAKRLAACGVASLEVFPDGAAVPGAPDWTGVMEIPMNDVRGVDVFTHTLIVHEPSNSAWVISTGGTEGGTVRGPIPLDWKCKKKAAKPPKRAAKPKP